MIGNNDSYVLSLYKGTFENFLNEWVEVKGYKNRMFFSSLSESQSFTVSDKLISALYKSSMEKYSLIDFGKIPNSKGDFDKLDRVKDLKETIDIIEEICGGKLKEIEIINETIQVLRSYKKEFCLGFVNDIPLVQMIYNSIVLSIYFAVSMCMNISINYIRTPNSNIETSRNIQAESDKQYTVVMDNLDKFNKAASKGDLKKLFDEVIKKENFIGLGVGVGVSTATIATVGVVVGCIAIIPIVRGLIYFIYNSRMRTSEFFKHQAEFLEINVSELRSSNGDKNVIKKQEAQIKRLYELSNKFELDFNKADKKTKQQLSVRPSLDNVKGSLTSPSDDISAFGLL